MEAKSSEQIQRRKYLSRESRESRRPITRQSKLYETTVSAKLHFFIRHTTFKKRRIPYTVAKLPHADQTCNALNLSRNMKILEQILPGMKKINISLFSNRIFSLEKKNLYLCFTAVTSKNALNMYAVWVTAVPSGYSENARHRNPC